MGSDSSRDVLLVCTTLGWPPCLSWLYVTYGKRAGTDGQTDVLGSCYLRTGNGCSMSSGERVNLVMVSLYREWVNLVMATTVIKKVNQRTRFLYRISSLVDKNTKKILAGTLIQPLFDYACNS